MSEEQQEQQQQQQRQQQLHHQQQMHKSTKDNTATQSPTATPTAAATTATPAAAGTTIRKSNIHEMRNQDYVSRLMAATPPYLYSTPVGTNNFFFSDMLRALVQARNAENARNLQLQQTMLARRPRKRTWSQHRPYYEHLRERKEAEEKQQQQQQLQAQAQAPQPQQQQQHPLGIALATPILNAEKPLELTHKPYFHLANKYRKMEEGVKDFVAKLPQAAAAAVAASKNSETEQGLCHDNNSSVTETTGGAIDHTLQGTPPAASLPPQELVLPPPPPVWYPPLYPPYGIDPLHFFIDLRVSGHIYDRKKENVSPLTSAENSNPTEGNDAKSQLTLPQKHRHGSAFTVPLPRSNETQLTTDAINLTNTAAKFENYAKYYDLGESKENQPFFKSNANYMLQNLPRLYSQFAARDLFAASHVASASEQNGNGGGAECNSYDMDNKSEPDCDADSDERGSVENCIDGSGPRERDIDVEMIDSIKYRTDGECSSRCSSGDEASITQID